jgi:hypothetical protein
MFKNFYNTPNTSNHRSCSSKTLCTFSEKKGARKNDYAFMNRQAKKSPSIKREREGREGKEGKAVRKEKRGEKEGTRRVKHSRVLFRL